MELLEPELELELELEPELKLEPEPEPELLKLGSKINDWIIIKVIKEGINSTIYNVIFDNNDSNQDMDIDLLVDLLKNKWILKLSKNENTDEIEKIEELEINKCNLIAKMPQLLKYRNGIFNNRKWYIIEQYSCAITQIPQYCLKNINRLGLYLINFLEWLHIEKKHIHGDIKQENIVINKDTLQFSIIDFETIDTPSIFCVCKNFLPHGYYYYGLGCYSDKSYFSYRMDLQAVGCILHDILVNDSCGFDWSHKSFEFYNNDIETDYFVELDGMRMKHTLELPYIINQYYNIINELEWNVEVSKPEIYIELKKIFSD